MGEDTDGWIGQTIQLTVEQVPFKNDIVPGIRVQIAQLAPPVETKRSVRGTRPPTPEESARAAQAPLEQDADPLDDAIPFAWIGALIVPWMLALLGAGGAA